MDQLENIANKADQFEREMAANNTFENQGEKVTASMGIDPLEAAANRAEALLKTLGGAATAFIDSRLELPDEEIEAGRASLAPVLAKYNLAGDGNGFLPYQEEITAGFYLGGLWRRFRRALAHLRAIDKEKARQEQEKNNGNERKHQSEEPPRPVPGEVGIRQEPDADKAGWSSE